MFEIQERRRVGVLGLTVVLADGVSEGRWCGLVRTAGVSRK